MRLIVAGSRHYEAEHADGLVAEAVRNWTKEAQRAGLHITQVVV